MSIIKVKMCNDDMVLVQVIEKKLNIIKIFYFIKKHNGHKHNG